MVTRLALGIGLVVCLATSARADAPRCGDAKVVAAEPVCAAFEAAPKLKADEPVAKKVLAVWRKVAPPVEALTGRETALVVLAPEATHAGKPFPPAAYICPGAPPTVYVPATLTEKVYGATPAYNEDFMAFVLGHELGHRVNDFTADGCQLGAFDRPGRGVKEEQLADFRGAFFAAIGGYSTRTLAKKQTVNGFLEAEFKVRERVRDERQASLLSALERFDAYEGLYATSLALTFGGEPASAVRLLGWADELVEGDGVPLPELKVMRALALISQAAPDAPWLESMRGTGHDLSDLRCRAIFASHTPLAEEAVGGKVRGDDETLRAKKALVLAKKLLERASELGADALVTESGRACAALYLGDVEDARRFQSRASKRLPKSVPGLVRAALLANESLINFGAFLEQDPPPSPGDVAQAKAWVGRMTAVRGGFVGHPELDLAVKLLESYPTPARYRAPPKTLQCKAQRGAKATLVRAAPFSGKVGTCPAGSTVDWTLPSAEALARSGTSVGVTACLASDGSRTVRVQLAGALEPPYEDKDLVTKAHREVPSAIARLDDWVCGCDAVEPMGVSDRGETLYQAACEAFGFPFGVLFVTPSGEVTRAVEVASGG
jgi:hypothetical protein